MGQLAQTPLSELHASGVTDVFDEIKCALRSLQVQKRLIMDQDFDEPEESLILLDHILDLHIQHMEELVTKGNTLTGQSSQEG